MALSNEVPSGRNVRSVDTGLPCYSPSSYRFYFSELRLARRDKIGNYGLYALCADAFSLFVLSSRPVEARVEW
jgi:hypothetical protein